MTLNHTIYDFSEADEVKAAQDAAIIAEQNDRFRKTWGGDFTIMGRIVQTASVAAMPYDTQAQIMTKIMQFNIFDEGNDPYGQRDFGKITVDNDGVETSLFWKIDLYDEFCVYGSESPTDPTKTTRILTIMQPHEY